MTGSGLQTITEGEPTRRGRFWSVPAVVQILLALVVGVILGTVMGGSAASLGRVGTTILDVVKGLAGPLLFIAIVDAFLRTDIERPDAARMIGIAAVNATVAITIGLGLSNVFQPGRGFLADHVPVVRSAEAEFQQMARRVDPGRSIDTVGELLGYLPTSLLRPFLDNSVISIAILAVVVGLAFRVVVDRLASDGVVERSVILGFVSLVYELFVLMLAWVMKLIPVAVLTLVARAVGTNGVRSFAGLVPYLVVGIGGLLIQVLVVYQFWIRVVAGKSLRWFWLRSRTALATAFGTGSSLATLPVTLRTLSEMGVSPQSARLAACVGTNLNNDGILLYEAMAVLFVAQAAGESLGLSQQVAIALSCLIAGMGISGIPDAGLISLLIVLKTAHLPDDLVARVIPFLLAVDWLIGRCRSTTNLISDLVVAICLDRLSGKSKPTQWADE